MFTFRPAARSGFVIDEFVTMPIRFQPKRDDTHYRLG